MQARSVVAIWQLAEELESDICIDGGWAVDALLERETRQHGDLDIALPAAKVPGLRSALERRGFSEIVQPDSWEHNFVLQSREGERLDVHSYELNPDGSNRCGVPYVADHLTGRGVISGVPMRCVPPHYLVEFHTGYAIDEDDWHDVKLLCEQFGLAIPAIYERFAKRESKP